MTSVTLNILDCSLLRKLKPIQNLSLIIFTFSWLFIFTLLFFNNRFANILFYLFITISLMGLVAFISISLFFLQKKKIGTIEINKEKIVINDEIYNTEDCYFDFNTDSLEVEYDEDIIKKLPFWGNFITVEKSNLKIEFEPNENLEHIYSHIKIKNTKRPALSMKTTDLFNNLMSLLWAAS